MQGPHAAHLGFVFKIDFIVSQQTESLPTPTPGWRGWVMVGFQGGGQPCTSC